MIFESDTTISFELYYREFGSTANFQPLAMEILIALNLPVNDVVQGNRALGLPRRYHDSRHIRRIHVAAAQSVDKTKIDYLDATFTIEPQSNKTADSVLYDMIFESDTTISFELYYREFGLVSPRPPS